MDKLFKFHRASGFGYQEFAKDYYSVLPSLSWWFKWLERFIILGGIQYIREKTKTLSIEIVTIASWVLLLNHYQKVFYTLPFQKYIPGNNTSVIKAALCFVLSVITIVLAYKVTSSIVHDFVLLNG